MIRRAFGARQGGAFDGRGLLRPNVEGLILNGAREITNIDALTIATGTLNFDWVYHSYWVLTANATGNFTLNLRGTQSLRLDSLVEIGQTITCALEITNGGTPYYMSAFQIDGAAVTPKYGGGSAFVAGNASSQDVYTFVATKTAKDTWRAKATQTQFA